jgi:hypothetical protein
MAVYHRDKNDRYRTAAVQVAALIRDVPVSGIFHRLFGFNCNAQELCWIRVAVIWMQWLKLCLA